MSNNIIILVLLVSGMLLKKSSLFDVNFHLGINKLLIYFFIPIITFLHLPEIQFKTEYIWLILTPWFIYIGAIIFFYVINKFQKIPPKTRGSLIMTSGIGSISFVGFPIFEMFYGMQGLAYGIILSLAGTFVVCNTIGLVTGLYYTKEGNFSVKKVLLNLVTFPPFTVLILSLLLILVNYQHPPFLKSILEKIASPFSILALLAVGYQTTLQGFSKIKKYFFLGQSYKLIIAPVLLFIFFLAFNNTDSVVSKICILGAGIGSMNTISIIAADLNLNPKLAMAMSSIGIPVSILTLLFIQYLIQ